MYCTSSVRVRQVRSAHRPPLRCSRCRSRSVRRSTWSRPPARDTGSRGSRAAATPSWPPGRSTPPAALRTSGGSSGWQCTGRGLTWLTRAKHMNSERLEFSSWRHSNQSIFKNSRFVLYSNSTLLLSTWPEWPQTKRLPVEPLVVAALTTAGTGLIVVRVEVKLTGPLVWSLESKRTLLCRSLLKCTETRLKIMWDDNLLLRWSGWPVRSSCLGSDGSFTLKSCKNWVFLMLVEKRVWNISHVLIERKI